MTAPKHGPLYCSTRCEDIAASRDEGPEPPVDSYPDDPSETCRESWKRFA